MNFYVLFSCFGILAIIDAIYLSKFNDFVLWCMKERLTDMSIEVRLQAALDQMPYINDGLMCAGIIMLTLVGVLVSTKE